MPQFSLHLTAPGKMATIIRLVVSLLVLSTLSSAQRHRLSFPKYSFRVHPMYRHKQFKDAKFRPVPVVMRRYVKKNHLGLTDTSGMMFTVGTAKYFNFRDGTPLGGPLDALWTQWVPEVVKKEKGYMEVELNLNARVYLAMVTQRIQDENLAKVKTVTGLERNWGNLRSIRTKDSQPIKIGSSSRGTAYDLPGIAYVVDSYFSRNRVIRLPTPRLVKIDGKAVVQYFLFFANPKAGGRPALPFNYPPTPRSVIDLANGRKVVIRKPVIPNEQCPEWLHDLYRAKSRDFNRARKRKELSYWRTWHPMVDSIYWCYFDHEHGSFPGKYSPLFDYTAWKTPDNTTSHGRQDESDQGFKVVSLALHDQKRFVIMTVHMHCSNSRRFYTRHHTMIFAVLDENWRLQMELHMKMDFGVAVASMKDHSFISINKVQQRIRQELGNPMKRLRRFNILNLENFPRKVDQHYLLRRNSKPVMKNKNVIALGVYEKWSAPLNTCQTGRKGPQHSLSFDFRNVATGKKRMADPDNAPMAKLDGDSVDREFFISPVDVIVGLPYCNFRGTKKPVGVFYTDPYFGTTFSSSATHRVRQFIMPGFKTVVFKAGRYNAVDPWAGHYEFSRNHLLTRRTHCNIENAVKADVN